MITHGAFEAFHDCDSTSHVNTSEREEHNLEFLGHALRRVKSTLEERDERLAWTFYPSRSWNQAKVKFSVSRVEEAEPAAATRALNNADALRSPRVTPVNATEGTDDDRSSAATARRDGNTRRICLVALDEALAQTSVISLQRPLREQLQLQREMLNHTLRQTEAHQRRTHALRPPRLRRRRLQPLRPCQRHRRLLNFCAKTLQQHWTACVRCETSKRSRGLRNTS